MPQPVYLSRFQLDFLRAQLQDVSRISISDSRSCKLLAEYLQVTHKVFVSESTLKRLFGLISSNKTASLYTLNLMSNVLGFSSWRKLIEHIEHTSFEEINHVLLQYYLPEQKSPITPFLKTDELKISSWAEAYQLHIYCANLVHAENWLALDELFACSVNADDIQQFDYLIFAFQPVCLQAFKGNKVLVEFVKNRLNTSNIARIFVLTGQVFDARLTDYYGEWIEALSANTPEEFYAFVKLMRCQKYFMNKAYFNAKMEFSEVLLWMKNHDLHPILKGRVGAWGYILEHTEAYLDDALVAHTDDLSRAEILQFASRLVWQYHDAKKQFSQFNEQNVSDAQLTNTFYQKGRLDCYKLALAYNLQLQQAHYKPILSQVNPHYFHLSDLDWLQSQYQRLLHY